MKRKNLQLPSWARVLPMMLLCLVVFAPFSIKAQCVLPFGQVSPWQAKYFVQVGEAEPANDASGNTWKDQDYDDSSWGTLTGPMGTPGLQLFTPNFTINDEYTHFFLRRTFTIGDIADSYRLRLLNDDDLVVYLNGNYIIGNGNNIFYIEGSAFVQGTNVLSIYYKAQGIPNYLDYELCVNEDNVIQEDGTFTTLIENGIRMAFKVIDEEARTVQVGTGNASAIDPRIAGAITIPTAANGYNVVSIGQDAFRGCSQITSVVVPEGVSEIKGGAFGLCGNLQAISLPTTLRIIGSAAFEGCGSLDDVVIPPGIESIPWGLFMDCRGLSKFEIPNTVTTIGCYAFENCDNLKTVIIPNSVKSIGGMSFRGGLETVYSYIEDPFEIEDGTFYGWGDHTDATLYVPAGTIDKYRNTPHWDQFLNIREMGEAQLDVPQTYTDDQGVIYTLDTESMTYTVTGHIDDFNLNVVIPSTLFDLPVTRIGNDALGWSELGSVVLPEGIVTIGMNAISDCQISSLYIPSTITSLYPNDDNPFSCNQQLSQIQVAEGNTVYDSREGCNAIIETATNKLIAGCNSTIIPESVVSIGPDAFYGCQFSTITIPARVTSIGSISFMSCDQLSTIYAMMPTPANLDEGAFQQNHYTNVTLYVPKGKKSAYLNAEVWSNFQNIVEMEPVAGYTQVGEQQMTLTVEEMKSQYSHAKFDIDKTVIASALGCNSDDIVEQILSSDGTLTDQANISPTIWGLNNIMISVDYGFWYNSEGYSDDYPTGVAAIVAIENEPSTYYLIQVPNSYHGGDNYSLDYYFTYDNKYYVYHVQVNVVEKSIKRLSEMTKVGGQEIVLNENLDTNYQFVPFDVDWEAITESLGCEQGEIIDMALKADGELDYESTATPCGFWFNADGYVDKWGINAVMAITKESTYGIIQYPNALSSGESFAVNYYLTYEDKYYELNVVLNITIEPNEFIDFADAEVKRICVENWDSNGDGELSYGEAAAVTDLGQVFKSNRTIELFEELQYFTGLTTLPECAFQNCMNLLKVRLPRTIITIEHSVFENCYKLTDVTLHEGIESIDWAAFSGCRSITSVTIPASTTSLSSNPFSHCYILSEVSVAEGNPVYDSRNNCNAVIETATNKLVMGCNNSIIPEGIVELGSLAFAGYEVFSSIKLPSTLRILDNQVFIDCSSLTSIDLKNVTDIGYACFGGTPLTIVHIPSTVERIDFSNPFGDSAIESITVDPSNPYYDSRDNCNAIIAKNFTNTILRDGKKAVNVLVSGCKNTIIPSSVRAIGDDAFKYCKMNTIDIPEGVESILYGAFMRSEIQTIKLPKSLTFLDDAAFFDCAKLTSVIVQNETPLPIEASTFNRCSAITLYVPYGSKAAYVAADYWKEFKEIIEVKPDDFLYANETIMKLGGKKTIALQLDNVTPLIAAEFRLQLPAGLTIEKDENNNLVAAIVGDRRVNHTLTVKDEGNGLYHFLSYSNPIRAYNGNSGDFITLSIVSDGSMEEGTYTATLKSIIFSDENEQKLTFVDSSFNISVINYTPGDANGDGSIDVMDVVKMVSHIMGRNPSNFKFVAADIDGNGKVNVMDLVNLINLIMSTPQQSSAITTNAQLGTMELSRSDDASVAMNIPFANHHVAAQFVVSLTDGAVLQEVVTDKAHQSQFTRMPDGRYKVMVFSGNNAVFSSDSPIKLQLSGSGNVIVEEAMFVDTDEEAVAFESTTLNTIGITTIGTLFACPTDIYTVNGRLVKKDATSMQGLAKGVYIVNNQKVIVK